MATKTTKTAKTKRTNPPDLTARNLTALKRRLALRDKSHMALKAVLASAEERISVLEQARGRLEERVHALEWGSVKHLEAHFGPLKPTSDEEARRPAPGDSLAALGQLPFDAPALATVEPTAPPKKRSRPSRVSPEEARAPTPPEPQDFTPPGSKAARRKGVA